MSEGPFGTLDAQGFTITDKGAAIQFTGPAAPGAERRLAVTIARPTRDALAAPPLALLAAAAAPARPARSRSTCRRAARSRSPRATASNGAQSEQG